MKDDAEKILTMEELWEQFSKCIPKEAPGYQRDEIRYAFFTGAAMFGQIERQIFAKHKEPEMRKALAGSLFEDAVEGSYSIYQDLKNLSHNA